LTFLFLFFSFDKIGSYDEAISIASVALKAEQRNLNFETKFLVGETSVSGKSPIV
jgi:hypothetical protein